MEEKYYHTPESVKEYIKLAEEYNGAHLIEKLKKHIPENSNVLELGSGPGTDWEILTKSYDVTGSDYSKEFLKYLIDKNSKADFVELDAATLSTDKIFDCIYSNKVLHHLTDGQIESSFKRQFEILNAGGIICHSFWAGEGSEDFKGMFVNYHTEKSLEELLSNYFDILLIERYEEFETDDSIYLIARKR